MYNTFMKAINYLKGYRTYILGALSLLTIAGYFAGVVNAETANMILVLTGFSSLVTLRAAIK